MAGFRSSQITTDILTVVSDKIARAFSRCGAARAILELYNLIYSRLFNFRKNYICGEQQHVKMLLLSTNVILMKIEVRYLAAFLLFSVIEGFEWF